MGQRGDGQQEPEAKVSASFVYLDTAGQHLIQDVSPLLHDPDIMQCGVGTLTILDGVNEAVPELLN